LVFGSRLMAESRLFRIQDPRFNENMQRFVQQCVVYDVMIGYKYTMKDLKTSQNIWQLVSERASPLLGFLYKMPNPGDNEIKTCKAGAKTLNEEWTLAIQEASLKLGKHFFPNLAEVQARNAFLEKLPQSYALLSKISLQASDILQQEMMVNAIQSASLNKAYQLGAAAHYGSAKASLQQRASYEIAGEMARNALPVMKNVFEAIAYGAFVFIFPLIALPNGYQTLATYLGILIWIQLWAPLYAVLNLIMLLTAQAKSVAYVGSQGLTLATSQGLANLNQDMSALTGWLSFSVPAIAYMMVKGGAGSFVHLANHLGSAAQSAIASTGHEVSSGNISLSNFSQGTQSLHNHSAFQTKKNSEHFSGQFSHNLSDGAIQVSMAEGRVFSSGSGRTVSSLGTEVTGSNNFSAQLSQASQKEQSLMESEGVEVANSISEASRDAIDLFKRIGHGESSGKNYTVDNSSAESKSFGNIMRFTRNLQKTFGVTQQEAMQLALNASLAVARRYDFNPPKKGGENEKKGKDEPAAKLYEVSDSITIGANAQGNYSKDAGRKISFEDLKMFAKEQNYNESIESIQKAIEHQQYGNSSTKDKSLSSAVSMSLEKLRSHRDSYQLHHQKAERLSKNAQLMQTSSFDSRTNLTQDVLEFIANQPSVDRKSILGLETARKIMDATSGPLADKREHYIQAFQEQRTQKVIEQFASKHMSTPASLETKFKDKTLELFQLELESQNNAGINRLLEKAKKDDLELNADFNPAVKDTVEEMNAQKQSVLEEKSAGMDEKYQKKIKEKEEAGDKNLFANLFRSVQKHNKDKENED
ncbi:MAG TPA: conjugal transfer protein TraG N-terminal domain-containing protein, partial [Gammaproteobacteria bacterium]|nr:conjugal transfer protein TraG N-terminal domain-containing protein [Gammaproteobacteria bacterium]